MPAASTDDSLDADVDDRVLLVDATYSAAGGVDRVPATSFDRCQLPRRYRTIVLGDGAVRAGDDARNRLVLHTCVSHLVAGGRLIASVDRAVIEPHAVKCGFVYGGEDGGATVWQRTARRTIHDRVGEARRLFTRRSPAEIADLLVDDPAALVLDVRTPTDRERTGVIEGSVHTPRTVLEWRADPTSGYSHPAIVSFSQPLVVVCNEGYSSSLGAATLVDLGYDRVTDMIGGIRAWADAGLPLVPPTDHESGYVA